VAILLTVSATSVNAQGLFGGLPGLPSFGGLFGGSGSSACGMNLCPKANLEFYVGWLDGRDGTTINVDTSGLGIAGITSVQHKFANRGLSLGLSTTACLSDRVSFIASGWYLVQSKSDSREQYQFGAVLQERTWDVTPQWWYVEGLFALGQPCGGITLLAGLRYDSYQSKFKNPADVNVLSLPSDQSDVTSEGWIPLIGTQYAVQGEAQSLVVRAVGIPTLVGTVKYKETIAGFERANLSGNYNGGGFLEFFAEYTRNFCGGSLGLFGRWNTTEGKANPNVDAGVVGTAAPIASDKFKLSLHRNTWTVGGVATLNFDMPMPY
jgi:hypothetical protein